MKWFNKSEQQIIDDFHHVYYESKTFGPEAWGNTFWMGVPVLKCPLDLWLYQELIFRIKPDLIIETGTAHGGSALYLSHILDIIGHGKVITIDIEGPGEKPRLEHPRLGYLTGDSTTEPIYNAVCREIQPGNKVMVILDSDHRKPHVAKEIEIYSTIVSVESYLIVEDTNINGHPVAPWFGPGPWEAVFEFLKINKDFSPDWSMGKFYMSCNPWGYLRRLK